MKTTKITLRILKSDILENDYTNASKCPITRALHRAGRTDLKEIGGIFKHDVEVLPVSKYSTGINKLWGMYATKKGISEYGEAEAILIKDFTFTIKFEE